MWRERPTQSADRCATEDVDDEIEALLGVSEVFFGVIDDAVEADLRGQISGPTTTHAGHFSVGGLGELRRARADGAGSADDEDALTGRDVSVIVHGLPGGEARVW